MKDDAIRKMMADRAQRELARTCLPVHFYRIRRRLAFALPVTNLPTPAMTVAGIRRYPWGVWIGWALEERLMSLGWSALWEDDATLVACAARDLKSLSGWRLWSTLADPGQADLVTGSMVRLLACALRRWTWVDEELRSDIRQACNRIVDAHAAFSDTWHRRFHSVDDVMALDEPFRSLCNIPVIGAIALANAATLSDHRRSTELNARAGALIQAIMRVRATGFTEGVAYDGYVLDFIADWLDLVPTDQRQAVLDEVGLDSILEQSAWLSAPGSAIEVAPLGDVEPREMPFHVSALAKIARWRAAGPWRWYLDRVPLEAVRSDGLAAIMAMDEATADDSPPAARARHTNPAVVLRSGWGERDLAVAVSLPRTIMPHLHDDAGSLVIGAAGRWLISDPGYQQYMPTSERQFALGPTAHNAPVLDDHMQTLRAGRLLSMDDQPTGDLHARFDLTHCYPSEADAARVERSVWLLDSQHVVVADRIETTRAVNVHYAWHGHPDAAWLLADDWRGLYVESDHADAPPVTLWFTGVGVEVGADPVRRLRGSRGQMTLQASAPCAGSTVVWWVFTLGARPPQLKVSDDRARLDWAGRVLDAPAVQTSLR